MIMARNHNNTKQKSKTFVFCFFISLLLVGGALVFNYLYASSSLHYNKNPNPNPTLSFIFTCKFKLVTTITTDMDFCYQSFFTSDFKDQKPDLPAPDTDMDVPRLDAASIQINQLLYVFSGYQNLDIVHSHVDVYNFTNNKWGESFATPKQMANSHLGMATDGRYIYVVSGQQGPQCRTPPVAETFVLDTQTRIWDSFPPLPEPRYAPATQVWKGRLHVMGGGKENCHTPSTDHWSIADKNGKPLEKTWRKEVPIPRGGPHRACIAAGDGLYIIGGQEGDFMPKPGSPIFKCSRRHEVVYGDVYMLDDKMKWHTLPPMPKPDSHIEASWVLVNNSIVIAEKNPITKRMILVGELFRFDLNSKKWHVIGKLPYRVKTTQAAYWNGWFYITSRQRDKGPDNPQPKKVVANQIESIKKIVKLNPFCSFHYFLLDSI